VHVAHPQPELAKKLGISKSHLNDIEKGRKAVSPERAARFAKILGYAYGGQAVESPSAFTRCARASLDQNARIVCCACGIEPVSHTSIAMRLLAASKSANVENG
jgi:transcriptional regulator with XRE-family HTH domain